MRIAYLEDDVEQAKLVMLWLEDAGHHCQHFGSGRAFIRGVNKDSFDILLLDWLLPDMNGDEVLHWVREKLDWHIPVLFITQRDAEEDIVQALERGADDYMVKPVKLRELLARIAALGRRMGGPQEAASEILEAPPYIFNQNTHVISRNGVNIETTHKEFDLALFLFRNQGRVLSRGHILESVWGQNPDLNTRTVDTHISRLRNKLGLNKHDGWKLSAIYQHGYRLERVDESVVAEEG